MGSLKWYWSCFHDRLGRHNHGKCAAYFFPLWCQIHENNKVESSDNASLHRFIYSYMKLIFPAIKETLEYCGKQMVIPKLFIIKLLLWNYLKYCLKTIFLEIVTNVSIFRLLRRFLLRSDKVSCRIGSMYIEQVLLICVYIWYFLGTQFTLWIFPRKKLTCILYIMKIFTVLPRMLYSVAGLSADFFLMCPMSGTVVLGYILGYKNYS